MNAVVHARYSSQWQGEQSIEGMAAYYSERLSQNIRRGQRTSSAKAQSTGGNRPLGCKTGPDKKFVIDLETARPSVSSLTFTRKDRRSRRSSGRQY